MSGTKLGKQNPTGRDEENLGKTRSASTARWFNSNSTEKKNITPVRSETKIPY